MSRSHSDLLRTNAAQQTTHVNDAPHSNDGRTREEFLTARQLAATLQVSESTVRRLANQGRIPSIRLTPRILRFHLPTIREVLSGSTAPTPPSTRRSTAKDAGEPSPQLSFADFSN